MIWYYRLNCVLPTPDKFIYWILMTIFRDGAFMEVQFNSFTQSCPTICNHIDCSMPGFPVHHQLLEFTQTHVHWVGDAIQPSRPAFNLCQHQGLFKWVSPSHQVVKVLEFQLQHQSWIFIGRTDAKAETPILCPPDTKSWLLGKDPDTGKDWRWEEKGTTDEMVGWHYRLNGHEFE